MKKLNILYTASFILLFPAAGHSQDYGGSPSIGGVILSIVIFALIVYALREVMMWYWKINKIIENQEKLYILLEEQARKQEKHQNYIEKHIYSIKENTSPQKEDK